MPGRPGNASRKRFAFPIQKWLSLAWQGSLLLLEVCHLAHLPASEPGDYPQAWATSQNWGEQEVSIPKALSGPALTGVSWNVPRSPFSETSPSHRLG